MTAEPDDYIRFILTENDRFKPESWAFFATEYAEVLSKFGVDLDILQHDRTLATLPDLIDRLFHAALDDDRRLRASVSHDPKLSRWMLGTFSPLHLVRGELMAEQWMLQNPDWRAAA